jgi:hypothetical protein
MMEWLRAQYYLYPLFEKVEVFFLRNCINSRKIYIFQMGKVGSSTVYKTLKHLKIKYKIFHIHFLSKNGIKTALDFFNNSKSGKIPMHIRRSSNIRNYFDLNEKIKVISLVRDPVARVVSDEFQNLNYFNPGLELTSHQDVEIMKENILKKIKPSNNKNEFAINWFDCEFKPALDIDVYNYKFDHIKGFVIINENNVEVLIIQMEKINSHLNEALGIFLKDDYADKISIQNSNIGSKKRYSKRMREIKNSINFDKQSLDCIYNSKYMRHFYSTEDINLFKDKWMNEER